MQYAKLSNGADIPMLGFGTWKSAPGEVKAAVKEAIKVGFRHIDCAHIYGNEAEIGEALKESIEAGLCQRDDLFITSKLWNEFHAPADVGPALDVTLANLQLDYLDMYLIHWPVAKEKGGGKFISLDDLPIEETWTAMEDCVTSGKTKGIGVSNFSIKKLDKLLGACKIQPAVNQVERHPYLAQSALMEYCTSKNIHVTGYSGLGSSDRPAFLKGENDPVLLEDPVIGEIAQEHFTTPAQVLLKWAIVTGASTIPKSVKPHRIAENFRSLDLTLSPDAIDKIKTLDKHRRYCTGDFFCNPTSPYTLENIWDE